MDTYMHPVSAPDPELRRLLWHLLGATRGGENRARIIEELRKRPTNLNQLALKLKLNYRAIQHHVEVLRKNNIVYPQGERYGMVYFLNQWVEAHLDLVDEICRKLNFIFGENIRGPMEISQKFVRADILRV